MVRLNVKAGRKKYLIILHFNSNKVRVKAGGPKDRKQINTNFNSYMVRLKNYFTRSIMVLLLSISNVASRTATIVSCSPQCASEQSSQAS